MAGNIMSYQAGENDTGAPREPPREQNPLKFIGTFKGIPLWKDADSELVMEEKDYAKLQALGGRTRIRHRSKRAFNRANERVSRKIYGHKDFNQYGEDEG